MTAEQNLSPAVATAREFAIAAHGEQQYGTNPYVVHLDEVAQLLRPFGDEAMIAGFLHDVVEDSDVSLEEIQLRFGARMACWVFLVSDEVVGTRGERKAKANAKLAAAGPADELALIVKAADRLANIAACIRDADVVRLDMYRTEHEAFKRAAYRASLCDPFWDRMQQLLDAGHQECQRFVSLSQE